MSVSYDLGQVAGLGARWHHGTAVSGRGSGISAAVAGSRVGDLYLNESSRCVYQQSGTDLWDHLCELAPATSVTVNTESEPDLGTLEKDHEYRCTGTLTALPEWALPEDMTGSEEFCAAMIFRTPSEEAAAPEPVNESGYDILWQGTDVSEGVFVPAAGRLYRITVLFDGFYWHHYVMGV